MYSGQRFTPGSKSSARRMINYAAQLNATSPTQNLNCLCIPDKYDKNTPGSDSPSQRVSYNTRIAYIINNSKGGKVQYGNFYLGQPLMLNYLGRMEGMPGGSGMPPLNRF